jgi:hypothetical protein
MGDEWFGVYAFCSLILLAFGQTLGHVCMLRVVILWSGYCRGFQVGFCSQTIVYKSVIIALGWGLKFLFFKKEQNCYRQVFIGI